MLKKIIALLMTLVLTMSFFAVDVNAETITEEEWNSYFSSIDNQLLSITPGADETQLNFAWHSELGFALPKVRISKNADMTDYTEFTGYATFSETVGQRSNNVTVTGIEENTKYYYIYGCNGIFSRVYTYQTHSFDSFKVLFVSDAQPDASSKTST
ncbi:MAG: fibronectin type III domain-containing protein, partial [Clostridia bacterium]|nr:fibronectin type III domain-containing protein [Clostridia bacterium]